MSSLVSLYLDNNNLTGSIPPQLGQMSNLELLHLYSNKLSGSIPAELGQLSSLVHLALSDNNLSGTVPPELGALGNLRNLYLSSNPNLEGLLPRSHMNLTLDNLDIDTTDVCPPLDEDYQAWLRTIPRAYGLYCPSTQIERYALIEFYAKTGGDSWTNNDGWGSASVGDNWYGITVGDSLVQQLRLPNNGLEGPLPPEITTLLALETLDLDSNELAGEFPDAITTMDALDTISVGSNAGMEGPLPSDMIEMTALKALQFAGTDLCSPPTSAFKEWRDSLDIAEGATCGNPGLGQAVPACRVPHAGHPEDGGRCFTPLGPGCAAQGVPGWRPGERLLRARGLCDLHAQWR